MIFSKVKFLTFFAIICSIGLAPINDVFATIDNPAVTASVTDGVTFDELAGAHGITTVVIGSNTYALVASQTDNGVQIIDITTPGSPSATSSVTDGVGGFNTLENASDITTVVIGSNTYALVASYGDNGVQIIDITTPGSPSVTASVTDGVTFDELAGAMVSLL
jgi:hypothetical protein